MSKTLRSIQFSRFIAIVAIGLTLLSIGLHVTFGLHAGALWRDEVCSVEIATMPTWTETWANMAFESFPALFVGLLRIVAGVPAAASDAHLRAFGVTIGLLILGALWLNARWLRIGVPLVSLALIGFNPMVIRYGDSIRAYGLGILLTLLVLGAMWRLVETFTPSRAVWLAIVALLSVQCLYYNAVLLAAVSAGAFAVCWRRRDIKTAAVILAIGLGVALSLLPYLPTIQRVNTFNFVWKTPFRASATWEKASETFGSPISVLTWIWIGLFVLAILAAGWCLLRGPVDGRTLFAIVTLVCGTLGYIGFLRILSYLTQPWYYIVYLAFAAACLEYLFASLGSKRILLARAAFAIVVAGFATYPAFGAVKVRQTNIDVVAARLESIATEGDLILINPFPYGISFQYYYHGPVAYRTVPPLEDLRSHRADLLKAQMMAPAPMAPVFEEIEKVLRAGHTVWLIGHVDVVAPGQAPLAVAPGHDGPTGWIGGNFYQAWSEQTAALLQNHAEHFERVQVPLAQPVIHYENVALSAFRGWRDGAVTP